MHLPIPQTPTYPTPNFWYIYIFISSQRLTLCYRATDSAAAYLDPAWPAPFADYFELVASPVPSVEYSALVASSSASACHSAVSVVQSRLPVDLALGPAVVSAVPASVRPVVPLRRYSRIASEVLSWDLHLGIKPAAACIVA